MQIVTIITVNLADGSKRQHEVDYSLKQSRVWLANHSRWALCNNCALLTMPKSGTPKVFLGHENDVGDIDCVANL